MHHTVIVFFVLLAVHLLHRSFLRKARPLPRRSFRQGRAQHRGNKKKKGEERRVEEIEKDPPASREFSAVGPKHHTPGRPTEKKGSRRRPSATSKIQ
jgi:hypothetical protein